MLQREVGRATCDIVWHWHKEAPPPAFQARGVEFSAGCSLRCQLLCHWGWKIFSCSWFGIKSLILAFTCWGPSWWHSDHSGSPLEAGSSGCSGSGWLAGCEPAQQRRSGFGQQWIEKYQLVSCNTRLCNASQTVWNQLPVVAVLGFPLGLVGRSEFGHLWSGLSGAGSVLLLPAEDQFIFPALLSFSFSFRLHLLLKNDVLSSLTPNATKHLESK